MPPATLVSATCNYKTVKIFIIDDGNDFTVEIIHICERHTDTKWGKRNLGLWTRANSQSYQSSPVNLIEMCERKPYRKSLLPNGFRCDCDVLASGVRRTLLLSSRFLEYIFIFIQTCRDQSPICLLFTHTKRLSDVYVVLSTVSKCKSLCLIHVTCIK